MATSEIDAILPRVIEIQRDIHAHPELGFDTVRTAGIVARELREAGLQVTEGIGRTGVIADLPASDSASGSAKRIAFRADMDALPIEEDNDLPHRSTVPGVAHLCGHDAHTAMLLGAARVLAESRDSLPCSIRFIFQPNEECLPGGAPAMIADGCLEGVDRIFGMHVWPTLDTGGLGIHAGPTMGQPDEWKVQIKGNGGHAAAPHETRDPIAATAQIVSALHSIVSRNVDPLECGVISVTKIASGHAYNVIPESAELWGTIRSFRPEVGDLLRRRLKETVTGVAKAMGVEASVEITQGYPVVLNDAACCDEAESSLADTIAVTRDVEPTLGGEDFAYYQEHVPGAFLFLGNRDESKGLVHFCHHPRFRVDDRAMGHGVASWVALARGART